MVHVRRKKGTVIERGNHIKNLFDADKKNQALALIKMQIC